MNSKENDQDKIQYMLEVIKRHDYANFITADVLTAMAQIDRKLFVPEDLHAYAYDDGPLQIGHKQTISQPYIVALMTSLLNVNNTSKVLEVGTGSGYQTAILSKLVNKVYSVEIIAELSAKAKELFAKLQLTNIHCDCHNGYLGWQQYAPFDGIIVTAAAGELPTALIEQLAVNANLIIPLEDAIGNQFLYKITKQADGAITQDEIIGVRFVPMVR